MDTQTSLQDDLAHGTLMGLQELDSHLSMFDSNTVSTPGAASEPSLDGSIQLDDEVPSHTIVVDSSYNRYSSNHMDEAKPASVAGAKLLSDRNSQYVFKHLMFHIPLVSCDICRAIGLSN